MFENNLGNEPGRLGQTPEAPAYCSSQLSSGEHLEAGQSSAQLTSYLCISAFENIGPVAVHAKSLEYVLDIALATKEVYIDLSKYMAP